MPALVVFEGMPTDVVIVAAGSSTRFGDRDKLFAELGGLPVIGWSLRVFEQAEGVGRIVVVTSDQNAGPIAELARIYAPSRFESVVQGGSRRRDSVEAGLRACRTPYVAIHDGARPLVTVSLVEACLVAAARHTGGAIPAIPVTDSIKEAAAGIITGNPDRSTLFAAQTPQVVHRTRWLHAASTSDNDETDDAAMVARLGLEVGIVEGDVANIKVTRPMDLILAESILAERQRQLS